MSWLDEIKQRYADGEIKVDAILQKAAALRYTALAAVGVCLVLGAMLLYCKVH